MKILILGGDGMLGHQLLLHFQHIYETKVTLRQDVDSYKKYHIFNDENSIYGISAFNFESIIQAISEYRPDVVINCIGIVKQRKDSKSSIPCIEVNALFPHKLARLLKISGARLIHVSTDCVFDGLTGGYTESSPCNATDLYGMSKYLGEVSDDQCLTIRTSIIGRELSRHSSLVDWFISQRGGKAKGYTHAIYSGLTTIELSRVIELVINFYPSLTGVYHVSSDKISKYDLLNLLNKHLGLEIDLAQDPEFHCDRSLNSSLFTQITKYKAPSWTDMIREIQL